MTHIHIPTPKLRAPKLHIDAPRMYITNINIDYGLQKVITFMDDTPSYLEGLGNCTIEAVMPYTKGTEAIIDAIINQGGIDFGVQRMEWRCVYCASPNIIERTHCQSCGGPRSWIL